MILLYIGSYCDHIITITVAPSNSSNVATDINAEIIMPDNGTIVMQMSKPAITYAGRNFINSASIYLPSIIMSSQSNTSQV